jgi:starch phosphorylase
MSLPKEFKHSYEFDPKYSKSVAYFSMEFALDQALKTYSGGLGFLAGSHMRSAYDLETNQWMFFFRKRTTGFLKIRI